MIHNIPQPAFEELIAKRLSKSSLVEIRKNHAFIDLKQVRICKKFSFLQWLLIRLV